MNWSFCLKVWFVFLCVVRALWWPAWSLSWDRRWHNGESPPTTPPWLVIPAERKYVYVIVYAVFICALAYMSVCLKLGLTYFKSCQELNEKIDAIFRLRWVSMYHSFEDYQNVELFLYVYTMSTCWLDLPPVFALLVSCCGSLRIVAPVRDEFCISNTEGLGVQNSRKQRLKFSSR